MGCHTQERHFDDARGVTADAQFQKQDTAILVPMQEIFISLGCGIPARILDEAVVTA